MPTPEDIRNQEFLVTLRGYDRDEVSDFLNDVAGDQQRLRSRIDELEAQVRRLEAITGEREPRDMFRELGEETTRILVSAEEAAQHMRREAEEDARNELETARRTAAEELDAARRTAASELEQARRAAQRAIDDANRHRETVADAVDRVSATIHELISTRARLDVGLRGAVESAEAAAGDLREMPAEVPTEPEAQAPEAVEEAAAAPTDVTVEEVAAEEVEAVVEEPAAEEIEEPAAEEIEEPAAEVVEEPIEEIEGQLPEGGSAVDESDSATVEEAFVQEAFAEEAAEAPADEAPSEEAPAAESSVQEAPAEDAPAREEPTAEDVGLEEAPEVVEEAPAEPVEEPTEEPGAEPAATAVAGEDRAFSVRAEAMSTIRPGMLRRLKRALHQIQDRVLEDLRGAGQDRDASSLMPGDDAAAAIEDVGDVFIGEAYRSGLRLGAELAGVGERDEAGDEANVRDSSRSFRDTVIRELRTSLEATLRAGMEAGEDTASLSERTGQVFRDLKGPIAEAAVDASLVRTYELGVHDVWRHAGVGGRIWVVGEEMRCPENRCAGNAEEGAVGVDQDFPSGDLVPPAHPGCTCTVTPG